MPTEEELNKGFEIGDWEVLPARGLLRSGDREERPEPKVFGVLMALARRDGDLVTRDELIDELWDGRPTSDEPINRCLSQLRGHLGDKSNPHQYIGTLTRRGYRLKQKVRLKEPPALGPNAKPRQRQQWKIVAAVVVLGVLAAFILAKPFAGKIYPLISIGVLPFENRSPNESDQYLVSGFQEELVQTLDQIPEFSVKYGRILYPDLEVTGIAKILDVDRVLSGTVQRNGDVLKISYQLADGRTGISISSGSITRNLENIFELQDELAGVVRNAILGESPQQLVSTSRPANFKAYDTYMRGLYVLRYRSDPGNLERAIELFKDTIRLDGQFGPAYLLLATAYALLPDYRDAPLAESLALAIDSVERGIEVDASIRDAAGEVFGFVYRKQKEWAKSEQAYIRATSAEIVNPNAFNWYSAMLASVGRLDAALEQALAGLEIDPSSVVINSRVAIAYSWLGQSAKADEFFERSNQLGARWPTHLLAYALQLNREGHIEQARNLANTAASIAGGTSDWIEPLFEASGDPSKGRAALEAFELASASRQPAAQIEVTFRTLLGDIDGAMKVARLLEQPGEIFDMSLLFIPEFRPLRQHPEFLDLMENLGVTDYWDQAGCVWQDAMVHCPDT